MDRRSFIRSVAGLFASASGVRPQSLIPLAKAVASSNRMYVTAWVDSDVRSDDPFGLKVANHTADASVVSLQNALASLRRLGVSPSFVTDANAGVGLTCEIDSGLLPRLLGVMRATGMEVRPNGEFVEEASQFFDVFDGGVHLSFFKADDYYPEYVGELRPVKSMGDVVKILADGYWNAFGFPASPKLALSMERQYGVRLNDFDFYERGIDPKTLKFDSEQYARYCEEQGISGESNALCNKSKGLHTSEFMPTDFELERWADDGGRINEWVVNLVASLVT